MSNLGQSELERRYEDIRQRHDRIAARFTETKTELAQTAARAKRLKAEFDHALERVRSLLKENAEYKGPAVIARLEAEGRLFRDCKPSITLPAILAEMRSLGIRIEDYPMDAADFDAWYASMNYDEGYPAYRKEFGHRNVLRRKAIEHYLSLKLCDPQPSETFLDVASSNSIVPELVKKHYGLASVYRQDLRYAPGVDEFTIGSDASSIPLPDASVDVITLHNSIEHFENGADAAFIAEAVRLLRPGGRLCVIPLFAADKLSIYSNPSLWGLFSVPDFLPGADVYLNDVESHHGLFVSPSYLNDAYIRPNAARAEFSVVRMPNFGEIDGCMPLALMMRKPRG